jgi:diaminopimelate decarboxylase
VAVVGGRVCVWGSYRARRRRLPAPAEGDLLCIRSAGAYGFAMSSNYNSRPRAAEVVVDGETALLARERETYEDLVRRESPAPRARRFGARRKSR